MRRRSRSSLKRQLGAEIVEFIVTLPVILIVFALVVELGIGFVDQAVLTNASRAAAREVIRGKTEAEARAAAERVIPSMVSLTGSTISVGSCDSGVIRLCVRPDDPEAGSVTVEVLYQYQFLLLPALASTVANLTLTAQTVMRMLPV